jgi:hypothetical protein
LLGRRREGFGGLLVGISMVLGWRRYIGVITPW